MGACGGKSKPTGASMKENESNINQPKANQPNA